MPTPSNAMARSQLDQAEEGLTMFTNKVSKKNQVTPGAPLGDQLQSSEMAAPSGRVKERNRLDEDEDYVESRLSKNIITQARLQAAEIEQEFKKPKEVKSKSIKLGGGDDSDEDEDDLG